MPSQPSRIAAPLWRRHKVISGKRFSPSKFRQPERVAPRASSPPTSLFALKPQRKPSQASSQPFRILAQLPQATRLVSATARPRWSSSGVEPEWFGLAPIEAVRKVANRAGWNLADVDLFELNEAFSVQALAVLRDLDVDPAKVNVHGGAVAIGHPIGASGARVLTTLLYAMERYNKSKGIAALCLGGGNAVGLALERV
jgi:acetyl-CoA acetyltransferase